MWCIWYVDILYVNADVNDDVAMYLQSIDSSIASKP